MAFEQPAMEDNLGAGQMLKYDVKLISRIDEQVAVFGFDDGKGNILGGEPDKMMNELA